jgi:hypothetical protein
MLLLSFSLLFPIALSSTSPKRGIPYVGSKNANSDNKIWSTPGVLSWYYDYDFHDVSSLSSLTYIPMLWGAVDSNSKGAFLQAVKSYHDQGKNISYVLGFNEPDEGKTTGGSSMSAKDAASTWIAEMEPVRSLGVKAGAPAVTGSGRGLDWLKDFFSACNGKCNPDFMTVHWYGPFEGLASFVGQMRQLYPNQTVWVTEFGLPNQALPATQQFVNQSINFLDGLE